MKHILITGASSGLGKALAIHYASKNILLSLCARDENRLESVCKQCQKLGAIVDTKIIDVADAQAMGKWITTRDKDNAIDIVIANAGISGIDGSLSSAEKIFDINMGGVINTIHPIIPHMQKRGTGQIALVSSLAGYKGLSSAPAYSASKVFVKGYGKALRGKLSSDGIKVNVICPGFVRSRITDQNDFPMPGFMEADKAARIIANGLSKNKPIIAFPWFMRLGVWFLSILPAIMAEWVIDLLPKKL